MASEEGPRPRVIVRRPRGRLIQHGQAWKVAYADLVTAMLALFIVLWLLTQADLRLRSQIAQYFRNQGVMPGGAYLGSAVNEYRSREPHVVGKDIVIVQGRGEEERLEGEAAREQQRLEGQARAMEQAITQAAAENPDLAAIEDQVIIQVNDAGLSIQVVDQGHELVFDLSSAELKPPVVELLGRIAMVLGQLPNRIQVGGHTDSRPYPAGSPKTNWELSFERADHARRVLEARGLRPGQVSRVLAYADTEPLVPADPLADANRRLSILAERRQPSPGAVVLPSDTPPDTGSPANQRRSR